LANVAEAERPRSGAMIGAAVCRSKPLSAEGLRERLFTLAFSNLVYAQIWEDPAVDLEALALDGRSRIITIASGGCNVLSYLTAGPAHITAVDINAAHVALNRLKIAAALHLPDYEAFFRFFGAANTSANVAAFKQHILPHLDPQTASYWQGRHGLRRRRRIRRFTSNFYRAGLLGTFIGASHLVARLNGVNPRVILKARTLEEQRRIFDQKFAPLFNRRALRWLVNRPASLYGLGIPPAQYKALAGDSDGGMADVLRQRLERLACAFPLSENYFAWQAFGRRYSPSGALPPYLDPANFLLVRNYASRVSVHHASFTARLAEAPDQSFDRYVLLDAQDWMGHKELTGLWREITRTAKPNARVIFRTAAEPTILPGRVPESILARWHYAADVSRELTRKDRSAIYGGFHLYMFKG
jgi:S-adenosylmethionine-diacylglycerol 3-amino-3-carboxypropyl transferase